METMDSSQHGGTKVPGYIVNAPPSMHRQLNRRAKFARYFLVLLSLVLLIWSTMVSSKFYRSAGLSVLSVSSHFTPSLAQNSVGSSLSASYNALQQWYNTTSGIWNTAGWWNGANVLTMLGDYAAADSSMKGTVENIYLNTFAQAQIYDVQFYKGQQTDKPETIYYGPIVAAAGYPTNFTDDYYDDDGWWALAWIQAYDVTGNSSYLDAAEDIFAAMQGALNSSCSSGGGGIWWSKTSTYVNAIANELFLSVAASLANRVTGDNQQAYRTQALNQWTWFKNSGMINSQNLINDGLTDSCTNNGETVWSYNQGVILGALVELNKASPDGSYLSEANTIAQAAISNLAVNGILHESCEPNCGGDGSQFKGVFMRNLAKLNGASPNGNYVTFINDNANSIISNDNENGQLSVSWAGPFVSPANASTQSSAMDALVAAVTVGNGSASKKRSAKFVYY